MIIVAIAKFYLGIKLGEASDWQTNQPFTKTQTKLWRLRAIDLRLHVARERLQTPPAPDEPPKMDFFNALNNFESVLKCTRLVTYSEIDKI